MKRSIRTRFTLGMIFLFLIILVLSVFSGLYLNRLSAKTSAILKENYLSVVYAREMSEELMNINQELTTSFLNKKNSDSTGIARDLSLMNKSLIAEKNNITEAGEAQLVTDIETGYFELRDSVFRILKSPKSVAGLLYLQNKTGLIYQQLSLLSQMNGKALEIKTDDAKASTDNALKKMTILATVCFLIGMSFTYSFASYFNRRFFQLFNGLKDIVSSDFSERIIIDGKDEFYEISLLINEMAEKLKDNKQKMYLTLQQDIGKDSSSTDLEELKRMLLRIKSMEEQAATLISKFEKK